MAKTSTYNLTEFPEGLDIPRINYEIDNNKTIRAARKSTSVDQNGNTVTFEFWNDLVTETNQDYPNTDQVELNNIILNHSGKPIFNQSIQLNDKRDSLGLLRVVVEPRASGSEFVVATHNLCDPSTWYSTSILESNKLLTTVDNITYTSGIPNWIDIENGKILREELLSLYYPKINVTVDGNPISVKNIEDDGDCIVNYNDGSVTFKTTVTGEVRATFMYATSSYWILRPRPGKYLRVEDGELQFTQDIDYNDTIVIEFILNPDVNGNTNLTENRLVYKTFAQIVDEVRGTYPSIPAIGGTRGLSKSITGFPLRFGDAVILDDVKNEEIRVYLKKHNPFGGTRATATFYCTELDK